MFNMKKTYFFYFIFLFLAISQLAKSQTILHAENYKHHIDYFNRMEDENIVQAIPNSKAWDWLKSNIPLFECPQDNFEEIYYYRWWTFRKHLKQTPVGYVFTEFLVPRTYADKYNLISSALGHHIMEGRWLHDQRYIDEYVHVWYRGNEGRPMSKLRFYSSWSAYSIYNRFLVNNDKHFITDLLPDLENDFNAWETEKLLPNGLFWQFDVRDAMEESISGGRKEKNARPSINSYMYGNAIAIYSLSLMSGNEDIAEEYWDKANGIKNRIELQLWNKTDTFFETRKFNDSIANVREEIGYIPWYFNLPDSGYEASWRQVTDSKGFLAPFGLTTAERRHPLFRSHGCCKCEWDGAVWPFATSQTLTAMANVLNNYNQTYVNGSDYFSLLKLYVESQYYRGRPYIGEYLDEKTGYWLKGDEERSRYYNHSTFADLIITGLVGLRPRNDNILEINPLIPENQWDWFCLDNLLYHEKIITILWDKYGSKYQKGKGLIVFINGKKSYSNTNFKHLLLKLE
jgi:hypothetical protein